MKKINIFAVLLTAICAITQAQNRSKGSITPTNPISTATVAVSGPGTFATGVEAFRFQPGLVTQLDQATVSPFGFSFETDKRWFSLGRLDVGSGATSRTLYGLRLQRSGQGLTMGYGTLASAPNVASNPFIEWIGNAGAVPSAVGSGDLQFFNATGPGGPLGPGVRSLSFTLRSDLTALFGETSSVNNTGAINPKVEINAGRNTALFANSDISGPLLGNPNGSIIPIDVNCSIFKSNNNTPGRSTSIVSNVSSIGGIATGIDIFASGGIFNSGISARVCKGLTTFGMTVNLDNTCRSANIASVNDIRTVPTAVGFNSFIAGGSSALEYNYGSFSNVVGSTNINSINCGVYSTVTGAAATLTAGTVATTGTYAGYFNGLLYYASSFSPSDSTLKRNIKPEEKFSEKLAKINPVTYNYIENKEGLNFNLPAELQHGFVAQELAEVYPELVKDLLHPIFDKDNKQIGTKTLKAVNYIGLISILTGSMKEMSEKIVKLEEKLVQNEKTIVVNSTKNFSQTEIDNITINGYFLGQNNPNPFKNATIIEYSLPVSEKNASILIFNLNGQTLKEYKLSDAKGSITIDGTVLSKGLYLYSLISDGKEIATKKMLMN